MWDICNWSATYTIDLGLGFLQVGVHFDTAGTEVYLCHATELRPEPPAECALDGASAVRTFFEFVSQAALEGPIIVLLKVRNTTCLLVFLTFPKAKNSAYLLSSTFSLPYFFQDCIHFFSELLLQD